MKLANNVKYLTKQIYTSSAEKLRWLKLMLIIHFTSNKCLKWLLKMRTLKMVISVSTNFISLTINKVNGENGICFKNAQRLLTGKLQTLRRWRFRLNSIRKLNFCLNSLHLENRCMKKQEK